MTHAMIRALVALVGTLALVAGAAWLIYRLFAHAGQTHWGN